MRKFNIFTILSLLALVFFTSACEKEEIVFEHEKPQFETREGAYLLEVIMPQGTNVNDDIFILGPINGGDSATVVNNMQWKLEKCANNNIKWGIYLFPQDFQSGTSLADGYTFVNVQQGMERGLQGQPVVHTEAPALGGRINVTVDRWESYFATPVDPGDIPHDGYVIYVDDQTTWDGLALYAWGSDLPELFGGWPGAQPTGTITIGATKFKYFDTGKANEGLNYNLIFNNNGGGIQFDGPNVTLDRDYYIRITDGGWEEIDAEPTVQHDGYAVFVINATGWDEIACYAWGDGLPELYGGWPGVAPTGTQKINGVEYTYFDTGEANKGLHYNFIFNNNNNGQQIENNDVLGVTLDKDYYFLLKADKTVVAVDPADPPQIDNPSDPVNPPVEKDSYRVYVHSLMNWDENYLYAWGDEEVFGGWPGKAPNGTTEIDGAVYMYFDYQAVPGTQLHFILNNNAGQQIDDSTVWTADGTLYLEASAEGWTAVSPKLPALKLYVDDQTGWDAITVYCWGAAELFGGWPGAAPVATETIDGTAYKVFEANAVEGTVNLIFNNGGAGIQLADYSVEGSGTYYLEVKADGVVSKF